MKTITSIEVFLQEKSGIEMLKNMIQLKANRYDYISGKYNAYLESSNFSELHSGIRPYFLEKVADLEYGQELRNIENELSKMCWTLRKSQGRIYKHNEWERKYEYSTERVRIEDVIPRFLEVRNLNRNIRCPFHEDKSPSFKIYPNSNRFVCFGCGARGSPIDFVMRYKNCSFKEAVEYLSFI